MSNSKRSGKLSEIRRADPMLAREKEKYENPLPSREFILQTLAEQGIPVSEDKLSQLLDLRPDELKGFSNRLKAMARDGQLMQNRRGDWIIPSQAGLLQGQVEGHPDGFGFLVVDDGGEDVYLAHKEMQKVLHGDHAIIRIIGSDRKGRREGKIVEVTSRAHQRVVGRLRVEHQVRLVTPENRRISQEILLVPDPNKSSGKHKDKGKDKGKPKSKALLGKPGQVVVVELLSQPDKHSQPIGYVSEVLGNYADPGMEIEIALRKHDLPFVFSEHVVAECAKLPDEVERKRGGKSTVKGEQREDITHLPLVTIDGETAKDFDDAVFCERQGRGFRLVVAIADVSDYVRPGSALDKEAEERGTSVYFPRRVIPMLPEKLSNGLCSLNPQALRLCMACDMDISPAGKVQNYRFYPAYMYSHARLTYNQVAAALYEGDKAVQKQLGELLPHLKNLDTLFRVLLKERSKRGAIDFDMPATTMQFDEQGKITNIVAEERNDAHRVIEECMLAANVCAAEFLHKNNHPALYRVHEGPSAQRLQSLREFLATFGLQLAGGDDPQAKDYAKLLNSISERPDKQLLQTVMLRSLRQAVYSPDNVGHFGLSYKMYAHFTSPIRRYPDLLAHRAIKAVLSKKTYQPSSDWSELGLRCSSTERRADEASRDVENWLKCYYMRERIGEEFNGSISSVVPFGVFVALDELFVEGLVHVSDLGSDYFHYDAAAHAMLGTRSNKRYRLSDRIRVKLVRVDLEQNRMDFVLAGD